MCCSEASFQTHARLGYATQKMVVIPNGFDLAIFKPDSSARGSVRQELGIPEETLLIGMVARFNQQKDHQNFIRAAARLLERLPDCRFLLCGSSINWENKKLASWIETAGVSEWFHLLGEREDIPRLMAALDVATISSHTEAFPNVIGEAMACGIPCVVADVGDLAAIVGDTGVVLPPNDHESLAEGWSHLLLNLDREQRQQLGATARKRIKADYDLTEIVEEYEGLYERLFQAAPTFAKN